MTPASRADWVLSAVLLIVAIVAVRAMLPVHVDAVLQLEISRNRTPIQSLDQPRDIEQHKSVAIDRLDLSRNGRLAHAVLGEVGLGDNTFIDLERAFEVRRQGSYRFIVSSDDGFALEVDGRRICAFLQSRPLTTQTCAVLLEPGRHQLRLNYFQAAGPAGLRVQYSSQTDTVLYDLGQPSPHFTFPP